MYFDSETETQIKINTRDAANSTVVPLFNLTVQYPYHGTVRLHMGMGTWVQAFVRVVCPVRVWCGCQIQAGLESRSVGLSQSGCRAGHHSRCVRTAPRFAPAVDHASRAACGKGNWGRSVGKHTDIRCQLTIRIGPVAKNWPTCKSSKQTTQSTGNSQMAPS